MVEYKKAKLFGKNQDGIYLARIEEIMSGRIFKLFGFTIFKEKPDTLCISNRHSPAWIFSLFTGYRQIGKFDVQRPHLFKEGQDIIVKVIDDKVVEVSASEEYAIPPKHKCLGILANFI